jgi:hypothetical protein
MAAKFRVELVWKENEGNEAASIFLTSDAASSCKGAVFRRKSVKRWRCRATPI